MSWLRTHRWWLARHSVQIIVLLLFWLGAHAQFTVLTGNLSASKLLGTVPMSDPFAVLQILATFTLPATTLLLGAALVVGLYFLIGGRSFCSWVCPINLVTETARELRERLGLRPNLHIDRRARIWVLLTALAVSALTGIAAFEVISPIGILHRGVIFAPGMGLLLVAALFIAELLVLREGWCGSLCPVGAMYAAIGRYSPLRIAYDASACDKCGDCVRVCPESQVIHFSTMERSGFVDSGFCTNCARCLEVCPTRAYSFGLRLNSPTGTVKMGENHVTG